MSEKSAEYREGYEDGYEQGVRDMERRIKLYYSSLPTKTMPATVEYTIRIMAEELLEARE